MTVIKMLPEDELQAEADALAADMVKTLNGILRKAANSLGQTLTAAVPSPEDAILGQAETAWMQAVSGGFLPRVINSYVSSAETVQLSIATILGEPAEDVPFVMNSAAVSYLTDTANRMVSVTEGTWARARAQLIEGFQAGESIQQLATRLQEVAGWSESRAATVARTEIISASNAGALAEIQATGAIAKKTWLATKDSRTREAHRKADGQTVSVNNVFIVDGEALDFPGDPQGEPGNVINCRCTMSFFVKKSELQVALDDLEDVTDEFDPADFVDLESLIAASYREELRKIGKYDEAKHKRGKGGRFAPKSGGGGGGKIDYRKPPKAKKKIDYTKPPKKQAPEKIDYTKPPKKQSEPTPAPTPQPAPPVAKKTAPAAPPAPPPPPAKKAAAPGKKAVGKKTTSAPPPPPDELDEIDVGPAAPTPSAPIVQVTPEVADSLSISDGRYAATGDRVIVGNRVGTVRQDEAGSDGLSDRLHVQFDDDPTTLAAIDAEDADLIEDSDGYEDILKSPYGPEVAGLAPNETGTKSRQVDSPFPVTEGYDAITNEQASDMQMEMTANDPWTAEQEDGLVTYSGDSYTDMNTCLRFDEGCDEDIDSYNAAASAAMRPTTRNTTVFRGANLRALGANNVEQLQAMVGATVRDHGFTSTSIHPESAFGGEVSMQIDVPEGTPAAYLEDITQNPGENELLLNSGTRFQIMAVDVDENGRANVHVRVVP